MPVVVITGVSGALGRRVVSRFAANDRWSVVGIDRDPFPTGIAKPRHFTVHRANLATAPLERLLFSADALIHLATVGPESGVNEEAQLLDRVLSAASANGIRRIVVLSSATVYGAHSDNPVPLTELAALRPDPSFSYAQQRLAVEQAAEAWRDADEANEVTVLRPATTLGHPDSRAWLAEAVAPALVDRMTSSIPATQFVHVGDVADAIIHVLDGAHLGTFNVASDGWLSAEEARELLGANFGVPIPPAVLAPLRRLTETLLRRRRPTGAITYTQHPWVVANDRLRETGWAPRSTSAEAFVAAKRPSMFSQLLARRRQETLLAITGLAATASTGAAVGVVSWLRRRR